MQLAEAQFKALIESAPDAMVIIDEAGLMVVVNSQAEKMFGYSRADMIGKSVDILLPETLRAIHGHHRGQYMDQPHTRPMGVGLDLVARRHDGTVFPVEISLSPLRTDQGMLVTSVIRDITERKQFADELERQVRLRTNHLNALLQFSQSLLEARGLDVVLQRAMSEAVALVPSAQHGAIYLYDPTAQRLVLHASLGFQSLPGVNLPLDAPVIGTAFHERRTKIIQGEWQHTEAAAQMQQLAATMYLHDVPSGVAAMPLLAYEQIIGVLLVLWMNEDTKLDFDDRPTLEGLANLAAAAIQEERSAREAAMLSNRLEHLEDQQRALTERLNATEAGMLQAARLAAVGQLAAAVAHEINNPLYATRNALFLLESDLSDELRQSPFLDIARSELTRIANIVQRMRDFYRPPRGRMEPHDLNRLVEETLTVASLNVRQEDIQVIFTPATDLPAVVCDADQLRQVFLNLMLNAIEAMPDGGTLTVRTAAGSTVALVEIQDTGLGIPEAIRTKLFEPFFTNKSQGTGLGLSISAHIVTQHGGQIEVDSEEGHGSIFRVVLPYQQKG
ncbi:MAG TPA: PAS domain S-box protein [Roseiflexaceae bacterium]|jgi:two-component system NtrC family sensor kinase|nr:PAS domain S-box protein [Roseiflexaceae bacterium]